MAVCQSGQPIPDCTFCRMFIESVRMMACVICASRWEASHCIACVTASTSMVRLEIVTLWAPLFSCTGLPPCLTLNPKPGRSLETVIRVDHDVMGLAVSFDTHSYFCIGFSS